MNQADGLAAPIESIQLSPSPQPGLKATPTVLHLPSSNLQVSSKPTPTPRSPSKQLDTPQTGEALSG